MQQSKKNDAPQTPVYSDSFKWILSGLNVAEEPSVGRNIACYGLKLFDIKLIRKYQL